ncbi:hypothetical protein GCM10022221_46930 [Actinocorallia aurea]
MSEMRNPSSVVVARVSGAAGTTDAGCVGGAGGVAWTAHVASVVVGIGGLAALTVWGRSGGALIAVDVVAAVAGTAAAIVQLRRPLPGALAAVLLAAVSPAATPAATLGALQTARCGPFGRAAAVAALGVAAHVVQGLARPNPGISLGWWLLLVCTAYAALLGWGALARSRHALLVSLRERAERAEAEQGRRVTEARMAERRALAREMHDVLAHRLTLIATHAGALEYRPDAAPEQVAQAAGVVREGVRSALEELRQVIGLLREADEHDDLVPPPTLADLPRLADEARQAGQRVRLLDETEGALLPSGVSRAGYRVVQEALTNARKHAPGQPVEVHVHGAPGASLLVDIRNPLPVPLREARPSGRGRARDQTGQVGGLRSSAQGRARDSLPGQVGDPPGPDRVPDPQAGQGGEARPAGRGRLGDPQSGQVGGARPSGPEAVRDPQAGQGGRPPGQGGVQETPGDLDAAAVSGGGTGLVGLTERVRLAGGGLDHRAVDGDFVLNARLPWPA